MKKIFKNIIVLSLFASISACSVFKKEVDETTGLKVEELYSTARDNVRDSNWETARKYLKAIENHYPYSSYAQQALIDEAYVDWKDEQTEKAIATIDRFLQLYPGHPGVEYMLYLKGLVTFASPSQFLTSFVGQKPSERDPKGLRLSYQAFKKLIDTFPNSRYASDAKQRMVWLVTTLSEHEANVAAYYYRQKAYIAAINRAQVVLTDFSGVPSAELALYVIMKSYEELGSKSQAEDTKRVLDQNFPNSHYYKDGLEDNSFWLSRILF